MFYSFISSFNSSTIYTVRLVFFFFFVACRFHIRNGFAYRYTPKFVLLLLLLDTRYVFGSFYMRMLRSQCNATGKSHLLSVNEIALVSAEIILCTFYDLFLVTSCGIVWVNNDIELCVIDIMISQNVKRPRLDFDCTPTHRKPLFAGM